MRPSRAWPAILDLVEIIRLFGRQLGLEGQVGQADDRVHGGADLVAHVGQEFTLGPGWRPRAASLERASSPSICLRSVMSVMLPSNTCSSVQRKEAGGQEADHDGAALFSETIFLLHRRVPFSINQ
jgi:hypothetical protein